MSTGHLFSTNEKLIFFVPWINVWIEGRMYKSGLGKFSFLTQKINIASAHKGEVSWEDVGVQLACSYSN